MKIIDYLRRRLKPHATRIPEHELYPICLTCFSVMQPFTPPPSDPNTPPTAHYCPTCNAVKGPAEVWGDDEVPRRIRSIAKANNIKPLEAKRP